MATPRKPLRRQSAKRAKLNAEVGPARRAFVEEVGHCQNPWCPSGYNLAVHEITNGPNRELALGVRAACLVLCWHCNSELFTDKSLWPLERQLALKLVADPSHFDLAAVSAILLPRLVHWEDIVQYLEVKDADFRSI